jgi:hypothetical protein
MPNLPDNRQEKTAPAWYPHTCFHAFSKAPLLHDRGRYPVTINQEANMKTKLAAICLSLIVSAQAPLALAQNAQLSSDQAWELVKETTLGEKLELRLKDGRRVRGEKVLASDSELSLTLNNQQTAQFKRDEIRQVWRSLRPDPNTQRFYQGVGTAIGLVAGVAIAVGISRSDKRCSDCEGRAVGMVAATVGMAIAGSLIGRKLSGGKKMLIYQVL